jgi:NAD(P)H-hydrate epimerase
MVRGSEDTHTLNDLLKQVSTIVIGPGLGRDAWAKKMFARVIGCKLPTIIDADALHWLSQNPARQPNAILTPHPGEAAKLLSCASLDIESDRLSAAMAINEQYQAVTVLKGAGTIICHDRQLRFCTGGNASLATGGSGDVLSGIIAGLVAQGIPLADAATCGVQIHARASELISSNGTRGIIASDLFSQLHPLVNPCHSA